MLSFLGEIKKVLLSNFGSKYRRKEFGDLAKFPMLGLVNPIAYFAGIRALLGDCNVI
jgi:hypothetical protein